MHMQVNIDCVHKVFQMSGKVEKIVTFQKQGKTQVSFYLYICLFSYVSLLICI